MQMHNTHKIKLKGREEAQTGRRKFCLKFSHLALKYKLYFITSVFILVLCLCSLIIFSSLTSDFRRILYLIKAGFTWLVHCSFF